MNKALGKSLSLLLCLLLLMIPFSAMAVVDDDPMSLTDSSTMNRAAITKQEAFAHDSRFQTGYAIYDMIDVSYHNETIDWGAVSAAGIKYAMVRVGYRGYSEGTINADVMFQTNVKAALAAGVNVGVYFYSQAITTAEAVEEAQFTLNAIKGLNIALPVAYDFEYAEKNGGYIGRLYNAKLTKAQVTDMCNAFCDTVSKEGYTGMVYSNVYSLTNLMNASSLRYNVWLAAYRSSADYSGEYEMWQYTSKGEVAGISGDVDRNYWYVKIPDANVPVISLSQSSMVMNKNESTTLTYVVSNEGINALYGNGTPGEVTFSSSDPTVATVDAVGNVHAVGKGTALITATVKVEVATQASILSYTHTASCNVTVNASSDDTPSGDTPSTDTPSGNGGTGGTSSSSGILEMLKELVDILVALFSTIVALFK